MLFLVLTNQCNMKIKVVDKFGIKDPYRNIEALMMDIMNNNTLWWGAIN